MKYELAKLETILASLQVVGQSNTALPELSEILNAETERIKLAWRDEVFSSSNENTVELYIQRHQVAIIDLKDQILKLLSPDEVEELLKQIEITDRVSAFKNIYQSLHNLLAFIERFLSKYFDLSAKIPDSYRHITARNFSERLPVIKAKLEEKELDTNLISAVTHCFTEFMDNKEKKVSYRSVIYLKELCNELDKLCLSEESGKPFVRQVCVSMVYLNFNVTKLFNYDKVLFMNGGK